MDIKNNKKAKRKTKIISIAIIFTMLIGNVLGTNALTFQESFQESDNRGYGEITPNDPLEYMQNEPIEPQRVLDTLPLRERQHGSELPEQGMREPPPDDGSTDRYIVKYNTGGRENFRSKLSNKVAYIESIGTNGEWEVLRLHEKTLPTELAESIRNNRALGDIAFIQPDYKLSLDSLAGDELTDGEEPADETDAVIETEGENDDESADDEQPADETDAIIETEDEYDDETTEDEQPDEYIDDESDDIFQADEMTMNMNPIGEIIVAVIDTGVDVYHSDLAEYIDTANMWDFTQDSSEIYDPANPLDSAHGTHIAGIIAAAARENGLDNIKILPLRVFAGGAAYTSDIIAAIEYAAAKGAAIINCSFGSSQENPALEEAMANADALFVCAAGNSRRDLTERPSYPACCDLPNIISVASVNADGGFSYFSNYGASVDITALGRDVWSALPENGYGAQTGTSMAAAYVTAVAASVSATENLTTDGLKTRLLHTADMLSNLQNKVYNGRRVSLFNAVNNIVQTNIIQNDPEDDFDVHGYQPDMGELWELFSSKNIKKVNGGYGFTSCLMDDGTVWSWGDNYLGQLGSGNTAAAEELVQVVGLSSVVDIATKMYHSIALKSDGTVWTWGYNGYGQIGDGTTTNRLTPVQVPGLTNITAISAGTFHSLALKSNGTVWAWGGNAQGQVGDGTTAHKYSPVQTSGLTNATAVAAGDCHSLALRSDGTMRAWGYNAYGQVGDNTTTNRLTPVQIAAPGNIKSITSAMFVSMAVLNNGAVWSWGYAYPKVPTQINGLTNVKAVTGGYLHYIAQKEDNTVITWGGSNAFGQLGNGTTVASYTPAVVAGVTNVKNISAGYYHTLALTNGNDVWAWGSNKCGELGNGESGAYKKKPVAVSTSIAVKKIAAGIEHGIALDTSGKIWGCGRNVRGELGMGHTTLIKTFTVNPNINNIKDISVGAYHTIAVKNDGTVWTWGDNGYGQLGNGSTASSLTPVQVPGLSGVIAVDAGHYHSVALKSDGTVWAWGYNYYGQLGRGNTANSLVPVQMNGLSSITAIASGEYHTMALKSGGTVWVCGRNDYGQLGDGTNAYKPSMVQLASLSGVTAITSKEAHSMALKSDGTVWSWGYNGYGQLGDGTTTTRTSPVQVTGLSGIKEISTGKYYSAASKTDGTPYTWGLNEKGQLGDGTTINRYTAQVIQNVSVSKIVVGYFQSYAYTATGQLLAWGENKQGQLGIDFDIYSAVPVMSHLDKQTVFAADEFAVVYSVKNISSFSAITFKLTYNPAKVTLVDFAAQTPELNVAAGAVAGTDLQILTHNTSTGVLTFKVNKSIASGKVWSGAVTIMKFKTKITGNANIFVEQT